MLFERVKQFYKKKLQISYSDLRDSNESNRISVLVVSSLLLLSDTFARVIIAPGELPAGIITSILGVPFFLALCLGGRK